MLQRTFTLALLTFICFSCASDEPETNNACNLIDCAPMSLGLEFVAADTGEDLFSNEIFAIGDLQIVNTDTNEVIPFGVNTIGTGDRILITLPTFIQSSDLEKYQIFIPNVFEVVFSFSVDVIEDPCCVGNNYSNVMIDAENVTIENTDFATYRLLF